MLRKSMEADPQLAEVGNDPHKNPYSSVAPFDESGSNLCAQSDNGSESQSNSEPRDQVMEESVKDKPNLDWH